MDDRDAPEERPRLAALAEEREAVDACRTCPLWRHATRGVPGEGPPRARLMLVGEQPGDHEDLAGRPFVGPAGRLLDRALEEAGVARAEAFVTNAVKHFKHERRGTLRLHRKPTVGEIRACHWWLAEELRLVRPALVVALGASALQALLGRTATVSALRGRVEPFGESSALIATVHPSYLLRVPDEGSRRREYAAFVADLVAAREWLAAHPRAA